MTSTVAGDGRTAAPATGTTAAPGAAATVRTAARTTAAGPVAASRPGAAQVGWLVLVTAVAAVVRGWLGATDGGPTLFFDEGMYLANARALGSWDPIATAHYPPLYSALLAPALLVDHWYPVVMVVSAVVSATVVPATWFLARSLRLPAPLVPAVLAALLPAGYAYAQLVMSENLSTPLVTLALALAIRGRRAEGVLLGVVLGAMFLTKYLLLPAVPVLAVVWLLRGRGSAGGRAGAVARVALPVLVLMGAWVLYACASGFTVAQALGASDPVSTIGRGIADGTPQMLVLWVGVYLGIVLLVATPTWLTVLVYLLRRRAHGRLLTPAHRDFAVVVVLLTVGFVLVASQHSFGASYNQPTPTRAWGRYLTHLTPALVVLGWSMLHVLLRHRRAVPRWRVVGATAVLGAGALFWWAVFYRGRVVGLPDWSFRAPATAADLFPVRTTWGLGLQMVVVGAVAAVLTVPAVRARTRAGVVAGVWLCVLAVFTASHLQDVRAGLDPHTGPGNNGSLYRKVVERSAGAPGPVVVVLDDGLAVGNGVWEPVFWGVEPGRIVVERLDALVPDGAPTDLAEVRRAAGCAGPVAACWLVTGSPDRGGERDARWGRDAYFVALDGATQQEEG